MNDALDTLRSFRPEAAGPTDALQLQERNALMETIAQAPTPAPRRISRPRRRHIALGIALALLAAVGTAGATGLIPDDVQQALGLAASHSPDPALTPQLDQAVERASAPSTDGGTLQLWTAPTDGGGTCAYLRHLDASGQPSDTGPISCAVTLAGGVRLGDAIRSAHASQPGGAATSVGSGPFGDGTVQAQVDSSGGTAFGQAPTGAAKVEVLDSNGAVLGDATPSDGWFLLSLSPDATSKAASLVALSASGASLVSIPLTPPPAQGDGSGSGSS